MIAIKRTGKTVLKNTELSVFFAINAGAIWLLLEKFYRQDNYAKNGKHNAKCTVQCFGRWFVRKYSSKAGKYQSAYSTENQNGNVWHTAQIKVTGSTCKCGEGHDKDTCSDCGFQFVTKYGGKDKKHHHSTAGTYETTNQTNYSV